MVSKWVEGEIDEAVDAYKIFKDGIDKARNIAKHAAKDPEAESE
jgi:hypothetical protein